MRARACPHGGRLATLALVALFGSCASQRPPTEIFLMVDADTSLRAEAGSLRVRVIGSTFGGASEVALDRTLVGTELAWPVTLGVVPRGGDATRGLRVEATLTSPTGVTARVSARTSYLPEQIRVLRLTLDACCAGVVCVDAETCSACVCVSDAVDVRTLPPFGADAGP